MRLLGKLIALVFIGASEIVGRIGEGFIQGIATHKGRQHKKEEKN